MEDFEFPAYETTANLPPLLVEKKPPRKPRPSEIAAKLAREKSKQEAGKRTELLKKVKAHKPKTKKLVKKVGLELRSERLDMRLTKAEKKQLQSRAKRLGQSVTSILIEAIKRLK